MKRSEWIAVGGIVVGLLATTVGSALYLSFKIDGVNEKVNSIEIRLNSMENDIAGIKDDIGEMRIDIAEMQVKVDVLWRDHLDKQADTKTHP